MRYVYKNGKMYEIKDKSPNEEKKGRGCLSTLFWIIVFVAIIYGGRHILSHHSSDRQIETTHYQYNENRTNKVFIDPNASICEKVNDYNTSEDEIIKSYDTDLGHFVLKVGNKEHYGLRHILARHTNNCFPNFHKARTRFDDFVTANLIVNNYLDYFLNHCVEVYLQKKNPNDNTRDVYLGYIPETHKIREIYGGVVIEVNRPVRCLLVVRHSDNSIITFYPLTKENELNMLDSWRRNNLD